MTEQRVSTVQAPVPEVSRDRWGRPRIYNPTTGKTDTFTRASTVGSAVEDLYNVQRWQRRIDAVGFSQRPDLVLAAAAHSNDRKELNRLIDEAHEAGRGSAAATMGTTLHRLAEREDRGEELPAVAGEYAADLAAYREATAEWTFLAREQFVVLDSYGLAGSPDGIGTCARWPGEAFVVDIKTGSTADLGALKFAAQLAIYAHALPCDPSTGMRWAYSLPVNTEWGLIIHLPAGQGRAELRWIDLTAGWGVVETALAVRAWRSHKHFYRSYEPPDYLAQVAAASGVDELREIYRRARAAGAETDALHAACVARKQELSP